MTHAPRYDLDATFPTLGHVHDTVEAFTGLVFEVALVHRYGPEDVLGAHADTERPLGRVGLDCYGHFIFSLSLGCPRNFDVARVHGWAGGPGGPKLRFRMHSGDACVMSGSMQTVLPDGTAWKHSIPPITKMEERGTRYNITFRRKGY